MGELAIFYALNELIGKWGKVNMQAIIVGQCSIYKVLKK